MFIRPIGIVCLETFGLIDKASNGFLVVASSTVIELIDWIANNGC